MSGQFVDATREQRSLLAGIERSALAWLARHTPDRIGPDHLSVAGLLGSLLVGVFYWKSASNPLWLHGVNAALALNWLGDSLDGTLARHRRKLRPRYGFYVDHMIDAFGLVFALIGLALSGLVNPLVATAILILYLVQSVNVYLATHTLGKFQLSFWRVGPTEARLLLALGNLAMLAWPRVRLPGHEFLLGDIGGAVGIVLLGAILIGSAVRNTITLYRLERV